MRACAGYLCALVAAAALAAAAADDESDSAPFTLVLQGGAGWRCGAALVSLRTALTAARCARGPELWARSATPGPPPRVAAVLRVARATGPAAGARWAASAAGADLALLELATALGGARPILLATSRVDCAEPACYLVRALELGPRGALLRTVEVSRREAAHCWPPPAPAADDDPLCLTGPSLCENDRGAGVVCGGKLCGVLSGSRAGEGRGEGQGGCGAPHAAASVPRWRRFLHCAHTRGACGRDGECAQLCTEQWLAEEPGRADSGGGAAGEQGPGGGVARGGTPPEPPEPPAATAAPPALDEDQGTPERTSLMEVPEVLTLGSGAPPTRSPPPAPPEPPAPPAPPGAGDAASTGRHSFEFEPNRADFTAGEYGDNAADYAAADEGAPPSRGPAAPPPPAATPAPPPRSAPRGAVQARVSPARRGATAAARALAPSSPLLVGLFIYVCSIN